MTTKHKTPAGGELKRVYDAWLPSGTCTAEMRIKIVEAAREAGIPGTEFMRRAVAFYLSANFPKQELNNLKQEKLDGALMTEQLHLNVIRLDGGTQPRAQLSDETIAEYWDAMQRGNVFPPVEVIYDGTYYWLVDGFHRVAAAKRASERYISANVVQGTLADAQWRSLSVNQSHGLRRTTADKQRAIESALRHPQGVGKSDRSIADYLGVDHKTVSRVRVNLSVTGEIPQSDNRVGADGRTINTANIGSKPAPVRYADDDFSQADPDGDDDAIQIDDDDEITYDVTDEIRIGTFADHDGPVGLPNRAVPIPPRVWPASLPVYCDGCKSHHANWQSVTGDAWICTRCRAIRTNDTMPDPHLPSPSVLTAGEGQGVRAFEPVRKWNPGIRVWCDGCNDAHADWITRPGDGWICRKCGVIRAADTMEEWTPANRQTPNYQSPAAPRTNPFAVKPVTPPARAAVSDHPDYDGDEWYTPPEVMTVIRSVLGGINLDPASCAEANRVVCAAGYYDKNANGLSVQAPWKGTVYLNPPYSQPLIGQFVDKFIAEFESGRMTRGIMLVNNCTETGWFAALATRFPVMFGSSRIKFYNPKYEAFQTRQGQAYFYAGDDVAAFFEQMSAAGLAYAPNRILIPGEAR